MRGWVRKIWFSSIDDGGGRVSERVGSPTAGCDDLFIAQEGVDGGTNKCAMISRVKVAPRGVDTRKLCTRLTLCSVYAVRSRNILYLVYSRIPYLLIQ